MQVDAGFHPFAEDQVVYKVPSVSVTGGGRTGKAVDVAASIANGAHVFDAQANLRYACESIIKKASEHFSGRDDALTCVVASYNAGINGVERALKRGKTPESATYDPNYVATITTAYSWFKTTSKSNSEQKSRESVRPA